MQRAVCDRGVIRYTVCVDGLTEMVAEGECWTFVAHYPDDAAYHFAHDTVGVIEACYLVYIAHPPVPNALITPTVFLRKMARSII